MERILLNDLLHLSVDDIKRTKIKFNKWNGSDDPLDLYKSNPEIPNTQWLLWHNKNGKHYFYEGQIAICFIRLFGDYWLLTTIKEIDRVLDVEEGIGYEAHEIEFLKKYFGRIIIRYHNKSMSMGRNFSGIMNELEVLEILNESYTGDEFPGYENVRVTYAQLKSIIDRNLPGWTAALQNQKAVYLQVDTHTGKMYVGSATSQYGMLLDRWSSYAKNGHGGNIELKKLVDKEGFEYIKKYFVYSILENYNARVDDSYILKRENWWKETLLSREFGYNAN